MGQEMGRCAVSLTWGGYGDEDWSHDDERDVDEGVWEWRYDRADQEWLDQREDGSQDGAVE